MNSNRELKLIVFHLSCFPEVFDIETESLTHRYYIAHQFLGLFIIFIFLSIDGSH